MEVSVLVPHYRTGQMTAYCISQLLKCKGRHKQRIIVIDNSQGEGLEYLAPFRKQFKLLTYPKDKMQSHGIAFDFAIPEIKTEHFITVESDSFPTQENWLDYYEALQEYDIAGSLLKLSGGEYIHPAGTMYRTSLWHEAMQVVYPYTYFPNMSTKGEPLFAYHLMVADRIANSFAYNPEGIQLHHSYQVLTPEDRKKKAEWYEPTRGVFHNGMGMAEEWLATYGQRNMQSEPGQILPHYEGPIIHRVGYEPGQWFCYWMAATGRKIHYIPTEVKWMPGRENQQQEYTLNEAGFKHLWGVSAYHKAEAPGLEDVIEFKQNQMQELYDSIA